MCLFPILIVSDLGEMDSRDISRGLGPRLGNDMRSIQLFQVVQHICSTCFVVLHKHHVAFMSLTRMEREAPLHISPGSRLNTIDEGLHSR
jgi:hypothetical protein